MRQPSGHPQGAQGGRGRGGLGSTQGRAKKGVRQGGGGGSGQGALMTGHPKEASLNTLIMTHHLRRKAALSKKISPVMHTPK